MKEYKIDATNKKLGRVASEIAAILMGKSNADFQKNTIADVKVEVTNASKLDISNKKEVEKIYTSYSGYPGGLKEKSLEQLATQKGYAEVLNKAVYGMIPNNRLKKDILKNLIIKE